MPLALDAAILSRMRSPVTSRSNWAKDSSALSVRRPMLVVVLKDIEPLNDLREVRQRARQAIDLVNHHDVDPARIDVGQQLGERGPFHVGAGEAAVIVERRERLPP